MGKTNTQTVLEIQISGIYFLNLEGRIIAFRLLKIKLL
jgi:hypothetical protein